MAGKSKTKKPDPVGELAAKLLTSLATMKANGDYPVSLRRLAEAADHGANADVLLAAVAKTLFTKTALLVKPPDKKKGVTIQQIIESPVGFWEDANLVACHPSTLAFVRAALPKATVADWKKWVNGGRKGVFKRPFGDFLDAQFGPEAVAKRLLDVLRSQKRLGRPAYPLTLQRLAELTDRTPERDAAAAVRKATFSHAAVVAAPIPGKGTKASVPPYMNANVALREDVDLLVGSVEFLETALGDCRSDKDQAFTLDEIVKQALAKWDKSLTGRFAQLTSEKLASGSTPSTIGWIKKNRKPLLFLMEDIFPKGAHACGSQGAAHEADRKRQAVEPADGQAAVVSGFSTMTTTNASTVSTVVDDGFAGQFEEAFRRLDRDRGSNNFVWLTDLRRALAEYSHQQFDAGLRRLREARRYMLNAGEGHFGVSDEQKKSSIYETGTIYLSVSRIES